MHVVEAYLQTVKSQFLYLKRGFDGSWDLGGAEVMRIGLCKQIGKNLIQPTSV